MARAGVDARPPGANGASRGLALTDQLRRFVFAAKITGTGLEIALPTLSRLIVLCGRSLQVGQVRLAVTATDFFQMKLDVLAVIFVERAEYVLAQIGSGRARESCPSPNGTDGVQSGRFSASNFDQAGTEFTIGAKLVFQLGTAAGR